MNAHEAFESGQMPDVEWKGLMAVLIRMSGAKRLTLTPAGIEAARLLTIDVVKDEHGNIAFEAVSRRSLPCAA